ncbi:DUF58 domain-containing protein [Eubacteriales bacterium OttesenSCG-928-A19]|nr:DUF58 domain-containing protein [Eubacteriales bacterium OttesenSCG-928-A19]
MAKRRLAWLLWCMAMGLLYLFENNTATRILLICSVALPLAGALAVPVAAKHTAAQLHAPKDAVKHVEFHVVCDIRCPIPLVGFGVKLQCYNLLTEERTEVTSAVQSAALDCLMCAEHCGLLMLDATVTIRDILGIFRARSLPVKPVSVWVTPELHPLEVRLDEGDGDWSHDATLSPMMGTDASDPFSVREYVPGDPVRQIHWKLSQKTGTVMLRELRQPVANRALLIFDASYPMAAGLLYADVADAMAEAFLSLSKALLGMGIQHTACWQPSSRPIPAYCPIASEEDWAELMSAFFSDAPARDAPIRPDDYTEYFAHVALIATGHPDTEGIRDFGQRLTVITGENSLLHSQVNL